jgi:hypothetical protein
MSDSIIPKLSRQPTNTYEEEKNINDDSIVNLYIALHGIEILEDELIFPSEISKEDVRIYSYIGKAGQCNLGNFYNKQATASTFLQEINSKMKINPEISSYNIIREQMETTARQEMEAISSGMVSGKFKSSSDERDIFIDYVGRGENIRTYNPIINKRYSSKNTRGEGGLFLEVKAEDGSSYIENIISYENVINIINNENLSQEIRERFHFLLTDTIISSLQMFNLPYQYYTNVKDNIIVDDGEFDNKKIEYSFNEYNDEMIISYKYTLLHNPLSISPDFLKERMYGIGILKYKLNIIFLSDIINLCSELGIKVLNIIDWSCRKVSLNYEPNNNLVYNDPKVIELQEREFSETNINRLLGGKTRKRKNLVKMKKRTNKKNHNMKKSHKNNKTKRRKIKKR